MKKYIIVGTTQSGSTRLFNMLRIICELKNLKYHSSFYNKDIINNVDVLIHKVHDIDDVNELKDYDYLILPLRDFRDSYISSIERQKLRGNINEINIGHINYNISLFRKFKDIKNTVIFKYENYNFDYVKNFIHKIKFGMIDDKINILLNRLNNLLLSKTVVSDDTLNHIANTSNEKREDYKKTLYSQAHNTSGGKSKKYLTYFTSEQNKLFINNKNIYDFLKEYGYEK